MACLRAYLATQELAASGLFDAVVADDLVGAAGRRALDIAAAGAPFPRARDRQADAAQVIAAVASQRYKLQTRQRLQPAYAAALDAVAATTLPFDEGLHRERELFLGLVPSNAAQALRYQFKAEREATRLPPDMAAAPRAVHRAGVIGAGTMGSGIAISMLDAGLWVLMLEQDDAALERGRQRISDHYRGRVAAGKMKAAAAAGNDARLTTTTDWAQLSQVDLVVEAVFEDLAVKQEVFRKIDAHARQGAVLATNTSYLDVDAIADATTRPQHVLGLHFFSPANVMKLLEVVRGAQTSADVFATGMAVGVLLKKTPVSCGNAFGFIGNRIYNAYRRQCEFMLEDGAWPEDVDNALMAMGFAMGPFAVADLSGLDIAWRMRKAQAATRDARERYVSILDRLCEQGRLGRKAGAGYYAYADGKQARATDDSVRDRMSKPKPKPTPKASPEPPPEMPAGLIPQPEGYADWLADLKGRIHSAQQRATLAVNRELVLLYWQIGRDILSRQAEQGWGTKVIDRLAHDLRTAFPDMKGFSPRNLKYMRAFADAWPDGEFVQQAVARLPWGHNLVLLDKLPGPGTRAWYAAKALEHNWSRNVLTIQIETRLLERSGTAATNFPATLPAPQSDLARESIKDLYRFDFLGLTDDAPEREIEHALVRHVTEFLLELGAGFAFVGRQVLLDVAGDEFFIDLLFYHLKLRCYVVIELKGGKFKPEHLGQLSFYLTAVDEQVKHPQDGPTIGMLLCKSKNKVVAEYALRNLNKPLGVADYQLVESLPPELQTSLPSIEQLERELGGAVGSAGANDPNNPAADDEES